MCVDTDENLIWNRIYRFRQIIPKTFFSEIDAHSICPDSVSLVGVESCDEPCVCKLKEAK